MYLFLINHDLRMLPKINIKRGKIGGSEKKMVRKRKKKKKERKGILENGERDG